MGGLVEGLVVGLVGAGGEGGGIMAVSQSARLVEFLFHRWKREGGEEQSQAESLVRVFPFSICSLREAPIPATA
jgi:hypothetical protein